MLFGYFIAFEALWNGQTPGKRLVGLRVVRDGGYPIDFGASLIRNLIRVGEQLVFYYLISAISALFPQKTSARRHRCRNDRRSRCAPLRAARVWHERRARICADGISRRGGARAHQAIPRASRRVDAMTGAAASSPWQIAARIRDRMPPELARLDDESLSGAPMKKSLLLAGILCSLLTAALCHAERTASEVEGRGATQGSRILPSGQTITPLAAPGAQMLPLATDLRSDGNADATGAMSTALSPDGSTLLVSRAASTPNISIRRATRYTFPCAIRSRAKFRR